MRKFIIILTQISILSSSEIIPFSIPTIDLDNRIDLQTTVDREEGVYPPQYYWKMVKPF